MNGPQHYARAVELLRAVAEWEIDETVISETVAIAQAHATLALTAATIDAGNATVWVANVDGQPHEVANSVAWAEVSS